MDATILSIRAITAIFGRRLLWPVLVLLIAVYAIIFGISWWLATAIHPLWWLFVIMATPIFLVGSILWAICFALLSRIHPSLNPRQTKLSSEIVDHIAHIAEEVGTPRFIILGRVLRDAVFGTSLRSSYIGQLTKEPGQVRTKFEELRKSF